MQLVEKGDGDYDNPHIEEDYYLGKLTDITSYDRDKEAIGCILKFELIEDSIHGDEVEGLELPFFAPANLSVSQEGSDANWSRMSENLDSLGAHESVLNVLGMKDDVLSGSTKAIATNEEELEVLKDALKGALSGRTVRVQVEDNRKGDASQISKLQKFVDE